MSQKVPAESQSIRKSRRGQGREAKPVRSAPAETSFLASLAGLGANQNVETAKRSQSPKIPARQRSNPVLAQFQSSLFGRIFTFLRARTTAPRQLRVAETVSL